MISISHDKITIDSIDAYVAAYVGKRNELYLYFENTQISDDDLRELLALFYRYKIKDMTQLQLFLNESNHKWFYENKKTFWYKKTFGGK